jgi:hypothetical protein
MLVKLSPGVNFINILIAHFSYESALALISNYSLNLMTFWQKDISSKAARKMLIKLAMVGKMAATKTSLSSYFYSNMKL